MQGPLARFQEWLEAARTGGLPEPTAMALSTASAGGEPSVRMVLLKHADEYGFVFYTNLESPKAADLRANPRASLCFFWPPARQVRISGRVEPVSDAEADAYFASRPRLSQIGAWASRQSRPLGGFAELEREVVKYTAKFGLGSVPRPPHWSGFRVVPSRIEFWEQRPFRLHERIIHIRDGDRWQEQRLFP
jgi:pyridoxamine 5'-phosphate oxidase